MAFVGTFSQIKLLFRPLVVQLVWYILKQLFTSVSVKVVDIYRIVNYYATHYNTLTMIVLLSLELSATYTSCYNNNKKHIYPG